MPHRALLRAYRDCDVCASVATLAELEEVLDRGKFDRYVNREERQRFLAAIRRNAYLFAVQDAAITVIDPPCRDPADHHVLALVLAAEAHLIVSSDADLLVLHPWRGIPIVTPTEFLARLELSS